MKCIKENVHKKISYVDMGAHDSDVRGEGSPFGVLKAHYPLCAVF